MKQIKIQSCYLPVPVREDFCGLLFAESLTLNVPVLVPVAVGLNTTLIVQCVLAAKLVVQVVDKVLKSPVIELAMLLRARVWLLVRVNTLAALVVPTVCEANVALVGVNVAGRAPVPVSGTFCGLLVASSLIVRFPVRVPSCVGVKVTLTMQLIPAAKVLPQGFVLVASAKSPLVAMLLMFSTAVPVFETVTLFAGEVVLITVLENVREAGVRLTIGPPPPEQPLKMNEPMRVCQLKIPLVCSYWFTYQNVQSSAGSTCIAV